MIKLFNCKNKNYKRELISFLDKRRSGKAIDTAIVPKILKDIKINGRKALLKYEKKFSKNKEIVPSKNKVNKAIRSLDPKIKKAIDLAYNRIFKFHSLQKPKDIKYVDNFKKFCGRIECVNQLQRDFVARIIDDTVSTLRIKRKSIQ